MENDKLYECEKELKSKVSWKVFIWAISIIFLLFSATFGMINSAMGEVNGTTKDIVDIKIGIQELKTDVKWIKQKLDEHY